MKTRASGEGLGGFVGRTIVAIAWGIPARISEDVPGLIAGNTSGRILDFIQGFPHIFFMGILQELPFGLPKGVPAGFLKAIPAVVLLVASLRTHPVILTVIPLGILLGFLFIIYKLYQVSIFGGFPRDLKVVSRGSRKLSRRFQGCFRGVEKRFDEFQGVSNISS